jgi:outer membrane protein OmpA-like peptidoglycan-associated protein
MDADAIKEMPIVRGYVKDAHRELVRPDCERNRQVFAESELFEPGQALLTAAGRKRLDDLGPWLNGLKHKGSEVVVVAYAARGSSDEAELARAVCSKQAEVVSDYLISQHAIQKLGWFTWRKVTALGMGTAPPPVPEREKLPPSRIEVVVFVPQR